MSDDAPASAGFRVTPATAADLAALAGLGALPPERPGDPPQRAVLLARSEPGAGEVAARPPARPLGTLGVSHDGICGLVEGLRLAPDAPPETANALMTAAEDWLRRARISEVRALVNEEAAAAGLAAVLPRRGYRRLRTSLLARPLPPAVTETEARESDPGTTGTGVPPGMLREVITYLEMQERPGRPMAHPPPLNPPRPLALLRAEAPGVGFYRWLYRAVGEHWLWTSRLRMADAELRAILAHPQTEIYVLYAGGVPAGYVEMDTRDPAETEIVFLGLTGDFLARGLGRYLLDWAIDTAWHRPIRRLWLHTCSFDHPRALANYQRAGFAPYRQEARLVEDPRLTGLIPPTVPDPIIR